MSTDPSPIDRVPEHTALGLAVRITHAINGLSQRRSRPARRPPPQLRRRPRTRRNQPHLLRPAQTRTRPFDAALRTNRANRRRAPRKSTEKHRAAVAPLRALAAAVAHSWCLNDASGSTANQGLYARGGSSPLLDLKGRTVDFKLSAKQTAQAHKADYLNSRPAERRRSGSLHSNGSRAG